MTKIKIFLTGGSGFIGRNIQELLGKKFDIVAPDHAELDLTDSAVVYQFFKKNQFDIVIHAANIGGTHKQRQIVGAGDLNLRIFFNIIRAKRFFTRMIMLGSGAEYDKQRPLVKVKETDFDECVPGDEYGFCKYVCAQYAAKVDYITHLRLFGVYGKYEDYQIRFISEAICRTLLDEPIVINQNVYFDYLYINDLVKILDYFISNKPKHIFYNVGRGESSDLVSIAEKLSSLVDKKIAISVKNSGLNKEYTCNIDRLKSEIGDFDYTDFNQSLKSMIAYYQSILPQLSKDLFLTRI